MISSLQLTKSILISVLSKSTEGLANLHEYVGFMTGTLLSLKYAFCIVITIFITCSLLFTICQSHIHNMN